MEAHLGAFTEAGLPLPEGVTVEDLKAYANRPAPPSKETPAAAKDSPGPSRRVIAPNEVKDGPSSSHNGEWTGSRRPSARCWRGGSGWRRRRSTRRPRTASPTPSSKSSSPSLPRKSAAPTSRLGPKSDGSGGQGKVRDAVSVLETAKKAKVRLRKFALDRVFNEAMRQLHHPFASTTLPHSLL